MINFFKTNTGIFKVTGEGLEFANAGACMIHKILETLVKNFSLNEFMKHRRVWRVSLSLQATPAAAIREKCSQSVIWASTEKPATYIVKKSHHKCFYCYY